MQPIKTYLTDQDFIKKVQFILIALFVLLIGLDIYLALDKTDNNTISYIIQNKTDNGLFVLTYFWGALASNFFFTRKSPQLINSTWGSILVISLAILMILFNIEPRVSSLMFKINDSISIYSISMLLGVLVGLVFWRQQR